MTKYVRARAENISVMRHPESGALIVPNPSEPVAATDPLVKAYPWAFVSDEDLAAEQEAARESWRPSALEAARRAAEQEAEAEKAAKEADAEAVKLANQRAKGADEDVEAATAEPGEKRTTRKR